MSKDKKEYDRVRYIENADKFKKRRLDYYYNNKEEQQSKAQKHYEKNKERIKQKARAYREKNKEQIKLRTYGSPSNRWKSMCHSARVGNKLVLLTREEFIKWAIDNKHCNYCNIEFKESGSGVDRVDSSRDYELRNIVTCCKKCNHAKNALTVDEFKEHITRVYEHFCKE